MADDERRWETLQDDWSEYGSAVQDAYEALVGVQVAKLDTVRKAFEARLVENGNIDWEQSIEPGRELFRRKVIEKSGVAYAANPYSRGSDAREQEVVAVRGFQHGIATYRERGRYEVKT